jgi:histidine ammonia-lyase
VLLEISAVSTSIFTLGEGEVYFEGKVHSSVIMERFDWQPIVLQSKEVGFTKWNVMSAYGMHIFGKLINFPI